MPFRPDILRKVRGCLFTSRGLYPGIARWDHPAEKVTSVAESVAGFERTRATASKCRTGKVIKVSKYGNKTA